MKNLLVSIIVACVSSTALAESYLCISEAAGGVYWKNGAWRGTSFNREQGEKYLFKGGEWYKFGKPRPYMRACKSVDLSVLGSFTECKNDGSIVRFDKQTLRFSRFGLFGGLEKNGEFDDTPYVEVGSCSRID